MTNGVAPLDPLRPRRRMLPSVSDVVRELGATTTADPSTLFKVARQVCAEELNRVKQGLESEPLEVLVARAEKLLDPSLLKTPPAPPPAPVAFAADEPFSETAATAHELRWTGEAREPFSDVMPPSEAPGAHVPSADEPFGAPAFANADEERRTESFTPEMEASTAPVEPLSAEDAALEMKTIAEELPPFAGEAPLAGTAEPLPLPEPASDEQGPGDATLAGLRREAESIDLASVLPARPQPVDDAAPPAPVITTAPGYVDRSTTPPRRETTLPGFVAPARPRRFGLWIVAALVLAGIGGYVLLRGRGETAPPPSPSATESGASGAAPAETPASAPVEAPAASAPERTVPVPKKAAVEKPAPEPQPVAARHEPAPSAPRAPEPASGLPVSKGAQLLTGDWTGAPIWVVHVGSYKDRPSAAREAELLAKKTGRPAHAFEVNLGEKGTWYRSAVGEFASAEEAAAYRTELASQVPRVGLVYKVSAAPR